MSKKTIRDPIHGQIMLSEIEIKVIDTLQFQRLRNIRQLGMAHFVYPGAHHTRFEHSIGTLKIADKMARKLELGEAERTRLRIAALLHDIGHLAFSHDSEEILHSKIGRHEQIGKKIMCSSPISDIISENDDARKIADWAGGEEYGQLISSDIGADRLDYLLRDAHYTGVAYGVIDWGRIISKLKWSDNEPAVDFGGLEAAESVMLARFSMFHTVYYHHAVRIARAMFQHALKIFSESSEFSEEVMHEGDSLLLAKMKKYEKTKELAKFLSERKLYKRALEIEWNKLEEEKKKYIISSEFASKLCEKFNSAIFVSPPAEFVSPAKIKIVKKEKVGTLDEFSSISSSLQKAAAERATLLICAPSEISKKVGDYSSSLVEK
ncbi:MAG: HD domain-containing protein [Candidatus Micrarchaeota archaeon]